MRASQFFALVGACLSAGALAASDAVYDAAVQRAFLSAEYIVGQFAQMGIEPNRTVESNGVTFDIYSFDHDAHDALHDRLLKEVVAAGPQDGRTASLTGAPQSLARRNIIDNFSCAVAGNWAYAWALNAITSAACGAIFTQGPKLGVEYVTTHGGLSDTNNRRIKATYKYIWWLPGFGAATGCATVFYNIVAESCPTTINSSKASRGGSDERISDKTPAAYGELSTGPE